MGPPLPRPHGVSGGNKTDLFEGLDVFFAFGYEDPLGCKDFCQAIGDYPDSLQIPNPTTIPVWPPLAELFRIVPANLEENLANFICIVICFDEFSLLSLHSFGKINYSSYFGQLNKGRFEVAVMPGLVITEDISACIAAETVIFSGTQVY